jgi:gamma-glutamyltranspeptidase / glutathione hydrolase
MRRLPMVSAVSALAAILLAVPAGARAGSQAPADPVQQPVAVGSGGAVASMDVGASQAGIDVLRQGGNAVDAAAATASALGVTIPFVAGPGGGGFMVIYLAKTHQVVTIDGRENCPAASASTAAAP